jgi:hypothetical protein
MPFKVVSAEALPALTKRFRRTEGWTGADGAYSIPLSPRRTLWLFADTWVGKIEAGRRAGARMVNNSAAWQDTKNPKVPLRFFWDAGKPPRALLRPAAADAWYWPGDGAVVGGRLYLFCKVVRRKEKGAPGFQFDWFANDLLCVRNPAEPPTAWKWTARRLPSGPDDLRLGVAICLDGDYLYAYGLFPARRSKALDAPLGVARIARKQLAAHDGKGWQYWCSTSEGPKWRDRPKDLVALFRDAAPEMSVGKVRGLPGLVATYTAVGLGPEIFVRQARRPEGPWSERLRVYRCPEPRGKLLLYGAKAHAQLSRRDGELILTYCRNLGDLGEHIRRPDVYFPQAVKVALKKR